MKAIALALVLAMAPNVAAAAGWFLVLVNNTGGGLVIAPEKYPTQRACNAAGRRWSEDDVDYEHSCVAAP